MTDAATIAQALGGKSDLHRLYVPLSGSELWQRKGRP